MIPPETGTSENLKADAVQGGSVGARRGRRTGIVVLIGAALAIVCAIVLGIHWRSQAYAELIYTTNDSAIPVVDIVRPVVGAPSVPIMLPGRVEAFIDTAIYARTNGYLKAWYFDIGASVKQGQLLAEIETPEVDRMLEQSRADLVTAQANLSLAEITAKREDNLFSTQSVAAQERDNAAGAFAADKAIVESKEADVARLEQLQRYEKILAPFDGVITARNVNIGALVNAGAATPASELFHLAALDKLRVYIAVPETYVTAARPGVSATLSLDEYPNESFRGTLVRTSNAIDPVSRTLLCEVDVDNRDKRLLPGAYAFVHLEMKNETPALTVPSNTLLFRSEGLVAGVVRQGQVRLIPVKIGRDYGDRVEIISGLQPTDSIVLNPMDSITDGARVRLKDNEKVAKNR